MLNSNAMRQELIELHYLISKLDEAMATPERIEADTKAVGGFVSSLDLTETAEQIINRAIDKLRSQNGSRT